MLEVMFSMGGFRSGGFGIRVTGVDHKLHIGAFFCWRIEGIAEARAPGRALKRAATEMLQAGSMLLNTVGMEFFAQGDPQDHRMPTYMCVIHHRRRV